MKKRLKSADVLDPNAILKVEVQGQVVGRYRRTGPNKWDDYELEREDGEEMTVSIRTKLELLPFGASPELLFKVRKGTEVLVLRWIQSAEDKKALASGKWGVQESKQATKLEQALGWIPRDDPRDDMLEYFLHVKADLAKEPVGIGPAAAIAAKLKKDE